MPPIDNTTKLYGTVIALLIYGVAVSSLYVNGLVSFEALRPGYAFLFPVGIVVAIQPFPAVCP